MSIETCLLSGCWLVKRSCLQVTPGTCMHCVNVVPVWCFSTLSYAKLIEPLKITHTSEITIFSESLKMLLVTRWEWGLCNEWWYLGASGWKLTLAKNAAASLDTNWLWKYNALHSMDSRNYRLKIWKWKWRKEILSCLFLDMYQWKISRFVLFVSFQVCFITS